MARVKRGILNKYKHKKFIKLAKGFKGRANRCYKIARRMGERALKFQYIGRKQNKRNFRNMFISIINTYCRQNNSRYSIFINKFNNSKYKNLLDRKTMSIMIQNNKQDFDIVYNQINDQVNNQVKNIQI